MCRLLQSRDRYHEGGAHVSRSQSTPRAVGQAVERVLARDELHRTRAGRRVLSNSLLRLAADLNAQAQMDVHELLDVVGELEAEG